MKVCRWLKCLLFRNTQHCTVCGDVILAGEATKWSSHLGGLVHVDCIPALIRSLGDYGVNVWLRWGSEALFPNSTKPRQHHRDESV